jgi:PAS domain S-box-containing protein
MAQHPSSKDGQEKMKNHGPQGRDRQTSRPTPTIAGLTKPAKQEQNREAQEFTHWLALVLLAFSAMALPFFYFLSTNLDAWQLTALFYVNIPFVIASSTGVWLERRGRIPLSVSLMLGVMGLVVVAASTLLSGIGIVAGLGFPLLAFYSASRTLTGRAATRLSIYGVLVGIASVLAGFFSASTQISIPAVQVAVPVMAVILIVLAGITLFRQFPTYSLRTKLIILLVGVALFSISVVAFATNQVISLEIRQQAGTSLAALAKGKALEIGALVNRDKNTLESLVINEDLQTELRAANAKSTSDPTYLARLDEQWQAAKDDTDPLIHDALNNKTADELSEYQGRFPEFVEIFLTNKYGGNIASTNRTTDYYQADEDWWQSTWNNGMGGLYISQPQFDESTGLYAIDIALPVYYESSSEIIGILRATVDVSSLKDTLGAGKFGKTGSVDLVFPDRQFLHSDPGNQVLHLDTESADQLASLNQSFDIFTYEGHPGLVSKHLVSASSVNDRKAIESLGWYVVTHQDTAEALAPATTTVRTIVLTALAVLLLASLLAFYLGNALTRPLAQLTSAAAQVAGGNLTVQATVTSQDEIGTLTTTFNSMTGQLHTLIGSMEQRVAERTRDLELASEVGRTVSEKVADLQVLLSDAVEMIRDRFDLYYTQIYLVESDGRTLKLRAGTGEVGRMLLQRGHHLLIGSGSINGRAASNKLAVIVADTSQSPNFLPNPLLPDTRSEMAVPLISGEQVVGVLDMQSERPGALSESELSAFEALAAQLAIAIQNATLFAEAQQSKAEVEAQARRLTRAGWQDFLDAVERSEQLGYVFDQEQVVPLESAGPVGEEPTLNVPIMITGEQMGMLQIVGESEQVSAASTLEIVRSIANLLANQIENLRLFNQAERYRAEAEENARRLTREGWESYLRTRRALADGYAYDLNAVQSVPMSSNGKGAPEFARPVVVRDEIIGELAVDHVNGRDEEAAQIVAAVAEQLSGHIENLRLLEEAEQRRVEIEQGRAHLAEALDIAKLAHWEYDHVKDIFTFNDHFFSIFHTTAEQEGGYLLSSTDYATRFVYPDDMPLVGGEIARALAATEPLYNVKLEHRVIYRDGGMGYISVNVNVERDEHGTITRFYGANQDITERKNAEVALRESEQRYQQILDAITDMVLVKGEKSRIVWANKSFRDFYGMSNEQLRDLVDAPIVDPDLTQQYIKDDIYVYETGNILSIPEEPCTRYDGAVLPFETVKAPIRDANGKIYLTVGVSRDIAERKKAEEVIRLAHQRAQVILESVTLPMVITRLTDNHLTFVNQPALDITQFEYDHVINQPAPDFYYNPEERARFVMELRTKGRVANLVVQLRRRDGEPFWALLSARTFDYQGEPSILTTFADITDRIHAQEALARRATELATVAQVSTTASTVLDPDKLLQTVVDVAKERFGLYHAHVYLLNESWNTLLLASGAGEIGRQLVAEEHAIPMDAEQSLVARAARSGDVIIVNDVRSEPGFLPNPLLPATQAEMAVPMIVGNKVLGVFDVQSNDPRGFTAEDANIYTTLAAQVAVALQNARLYVEQSATVTQLRELDRLKSSFLANMSHELRTPLNSILGFADVMLEELDGPLTENMDNDLRLIQKNGQHLLHLINDVLDMAKIEAGRMNLNPEKFRIYEVLDEVTSITSTLASEKNLSLFIDECSDREVEVYADHTRLRQVMINLVNNAIKFTETGKISLKVEPMEGARVLISVKDTGIGIPPDKLEAVFQEFTQVDASSTRKAGGTGLGLPISRRLVEMHGGRLWAESSGVKGEGSVFYVELPVEARITEVIEKTTK